MARAKPARTSPPRLAALPDDVLLGVGHALPLGCLVSLASTCRKLRLLFHLNTGFGTRWLRKHGTEVDVEVKIRGRLGRFDALDFGVLEDGRPFLRHEVG